MFPCSAMLYHSAMICCLPATACQQNEASSLALTNITCTTAGCSCWLSILYLPVLQTAGMLHSRRCPCFYSRLLIRSCSELLTFDASLHLLKPVYRGYKLLSHKPSSLLTAVYLTEMRIVYAHAALVMLGEWWSTEIVTVAAGRLDNATEALSAMSVFQQTNSLAFMVPLGLSIGVGIRHLTLPCSHQSPLYFLQISPFETFAAKKSEEAGKRSDASAMRSIGILAVSWDLGQAGFVCVQSGMGGHATCQAFSLHYLEKSLGVWDSACNHAHHWMWSLAGFRLQAWQAA